MTEVTTNSYTEIQKRKIDSVLPPECELISIASGKLFSSDMDGRIWLFSDLEGLICFLANYSKKTTYLVIYDSYSFEKLFQFELYKDFNQFYYTLASDFRCFEVENGFFGIQFEIPKEAEVFDLVIKKFSGKLLDEMFNADLPKKQTDEIALKEKALHFCDILKEKWSKNSAKRYDASYAEQGLEIVKARNFEILNNINYNNTTKRFEIGEISNELKQLFIDLGIRKRDLKDVHFAFWLFKRLILGIGDDKKTSTTQLENIPHHFVPPENEDDDDNPTQSATSNTISMTQSKTTPLKENQTTKNKEENKKRAQTKKLANKTAAQKIGHKAQASIPQAQNEQNIPQQSNNPNIPSIPVPPPLPAPPLFGTIPQPPALSNIPVPPPVKFANVNNENDGEEQQQLSREDELKKAMNLKKVVEVEQKPKELTMAEQLKNVKLVKIEPGKNVGKKQIITKNEKNFLQNALASAIANRKKNLREHEESDSEEEDSDW